MWMITAEVWGCFLMEYPLFFNIRYTSWKAYKIVLHFPEGHPDIVSSFHFLDKRSRLVMYSMKHDREWLSLQSISSKYDFTSEEQGERSYLNLIQLYLCSPRGNTWRECIAEISTWARNRPEHADVRVCPCHAHQAGGSAPLQSSMADLPQACAQGPCWPPQSFPPPNTDEKLALPRGRCFLPCAAFWGGSWALQSTFC